MVPINVYTYMMNITEANFNPDEKPNWHLMHDMVKEYDLMDLCPLSMQSLLEKMDNNLNFAMKFELNWNRGGQLYHVDFKPELNDPYYKCL